ncbi:MAG: aminotransferase class I/II-fold pyridoxal phosphate-dependent enzyme [Bacteroidales bacterium]|jgi:cystathionine gamma-lyase|nr:aminotransferase class I/II-fold pyridoxal phosphate-dependent enzyme [Bacteroidales bacterium]
MTKKIRSYGFSTRSVRIGEEPDFRDGTAGDVVTPLHLSTTYAWEDPSTPHSEFEYIRSHNPTRKVFETKIASVENAKYGLGFASGLAAETAVMQTIFRPGDHVIGFDDLYGGTRRLFADVFTYLDISYVDLANPDDFEKAVRPETKAVWIESPTNPLMKICDISAIAAIAHRNGMIVVVDNTFLSPYFQRPVELGADIVVHSTTKYIGGHSDALGGAIVTSDELLHEKLKTMQNSTGGVLSPFDSYLNIRGIKTLAIRMEQHQKNAFIIARFLEKHPNVEKVYYPGLEYHPGHDIVKRQTTGFGGMLSFNIKGDIKTTKTFLKKLKLFAIAESLGGVESLIELPTLMTHSTVPEDVKQAIGITDTLIRISVGLEDADDLVADLKQALDAVSI